MTVIDIAQIQMRRGTAAVWALANPVLLQGEPGMETDTGVIKVGDGTTAWAALLQGVVAKSLVTTKGDLVGASAGSTPVRVPVGPDGSSLMASSAAASGLAWAGNQAAGKNRLLNSDFGIWQRGTSFVTAGKVYCADRWEIWASGATTNVTAAQVAGTNGVKWAMKFGRQAGVVGSNIPLLSTTLESLESLEYAGKQVTVSFEALKGANYSGGTLSVNLLTGIGTDQNFSAFTGSVTQSSFITLTAGMLVHSVTFTVASGVTQVAVQFAYTPTGTAGADDTVTVQKVQLELGAVATPFAINGANVASELSSCKRFARRFSSALAAGAHFGIGRVTSATAALILIPFDTEMRAVPTFAATNITGLNLNGVAVTSITLDWATPYNAGITVNVAAGLTAGQAADLQSSTTAGILDFIAEL
jgi:hypothetical protein